MNLTAWFDVSLCSRLCLALVHSLWESIAIAVLVAGTSMLLPKRSAQAKYVVHVGGLLGVLAAFVATLAWSARPAPTNAPAVVAADRAAEGESSSDERRTWSAVDLGDGGPFSSGDPGNNVAAGSAIVGEVEVSSPLASVRAFDAAVDPAVWRARWRRASPALLVGYGLGVVVMLQRLGRGIRAEQRLRAEATMVDDAALLAFVQEQSRRFVLRARPKLATVARLTVPKVIGLVRPLILLPAAMLTGLPADELRLVLAHELAHVRRYDLWANLLQRVVEVVLFFNPVVWYLSRRVSTLREYCCDDAVCHTIEPGLEPVSVRYARALLHVAELSCSLAPSGQGAGPLGCREVTAARALGRGPSELKRRIGRLLGVPVHDPVRLSRGGLTLATALCVVLLCGPVTWPYASGAGQASAEGALSGSSPDSAEAARATDHAAAKDEASAAAENAVPPRAAGHCDDPTLNFHWMQVHAVVAESGEPLPDAPLRIVYWRGNKRYNVAYATDERGTAQVELPINQDLGSVALEAHPDRLVPVYYSWSSQSRALAPPKALELRFEPATSVGGVIRDEAGAPVPRTTVELQLPATFSETRSLVFRAAMVRSDDQGRWRCDTVPVDLADLSTEVRAPGYLPTHVAASKRELLDLAAVTVLHQGLVVTGRVTDEAGKPIANARALLGIDRFGSNDPTARTDDQGHFVIRNCKPGVSAVTVMAEGFAPDFQRVVVGPLPNANPPAGDSPPSAGSGEALRFVLGPAGRIRARVVDPHGNPVSGSSVIADTWRGMRALRWRVETDAEGRIDWRSAPHDTVLFDIGKSGFLSARGMALSARDEEYEIILHPTVVIAGSVVDAGSGEPVDKFKVIQGVVWQGRQSASWDRDAALAFAGGRYEVKFSEPRPRVQLRVEAEGYRPAESAPFELDAGDREINFRLERGAGFHGTVIAPDGTPAAGADVVLLTKGGRVSLRNSRYDRGGSEPHVRTDEQGRFRFGDSAAPALLIAIHDQGYGELLTDQPETEQALPLRAWGKITGQMFIGDRPAARHPVDFHPLRSASDAATAVTTVRLSDPAATLAAASPKGSKNTLVAAEMSPQELARTILDLLDIHAFDNRNAQTDADGRFTFENVIPGRVSVARVFVVSHGKSWSHAYSHQQELDVAAGKSSQVVLGGTGRPVVGRINVPSVNGKPYSWVENETVQMSQPPAGRQASAQGPTMHRLFRGFVSPDGSFRIDDVPPGEYRLMVRITPPSDSGGCGFGDAIGSANATVTVPELPDGATRTDDAWDVGEIAATMLPVLEVGQEAPAFDLTTRDGRQVTLAACRGKIVLLDVWATWCQPCIAELPHLQELHAKFKDDPNFVMLGVSLDQDRDALDEFLKNRPLPYPQAWVAGATSNSFAGDYAIRSVPATFLIGADGRVLAKGLQGERLRQAVAHALRTVPPQPPAERE